MNEEETAGPIEKEYDPRKMLMVSILIDRVLPDITMVIKGKT